MLPTAPLPNTRLTVDDFPLPVRSTTQVLDALTEFAPGQKLIAQIQFQLANGAYRATIAQRDVTLALPFSAKAGDSLELEVVETDGRIAFAVSKQATKGEADDGAPPASASTVLSRTGQLIGKLMQDGDADQQRPAPLNAGEPILKAPPTTSKDVAPALQQAVARSGLFYESHQAAWIEGKLPEAALKQEPQALLTRYLQNNSGNAALPSPTGSSLPSASGQPAVSTPSQASLPGTHIPAAPESPTGHDDGPALLNKSVFSPADAAPANERLRDQSPTPNADTTGAPPTRPPAGSPAALLPRFMRQLTGLAKTVFPFQGAIWPGQQIHWEIVDEDGSRNGQNNDDAPRQWKTRMKLLLPSLGDIDATLQLDGNDIVIKMTAGETHAQTTLKSGIEGLRSRLEQAGLRLMSLDVKGYETAGSNASDEHAE